MFVAKSSELTSRNSTRVIATLCLAGLFLVLLPKSGNAQNAKAISFKNLSSEQFKSNFKKHIDQGYFPTAFRVRISNATDRYSVTYQQNLDDVAFQTYHRLSPERFNTLNRKFIGEGYKLTIHQQYDWNKSKRHLGVWTRKPVVGQMDEIWSTIDQIPVTGDFREQTKPLDDMMTKFLLDHQIPGATLAVSFRGKIIYKRGFGYRDRDKKIAMNPETRMRLASISKPITAVAIMKLVEEGKLSLDDKVFDLLKIKPVSESTQIDPRLMDVTVMHLLRHRGGWDRAKSFDPMFRQTTVAKHVGKPTPVGPEDIIRYMLTKPLDHDPGDKYAYSNFGYSLLGRIIEEVTGRDYELYVLDEVLRPLKITTMKIGSTRLEELGSRETRYYTRSGQKVNSILEPGKQVAEPYGRWHLESFDAHGGWISSAPDLVRFASAFDDPDRCQLIPAKRIRQMFVPIDDKEVDQVNLHRYYGCGWSIVMWERGRRYNAFHSGLLAGTSTMVVRRHDGYNWAVLFNTDRDAKGNALSSVIDPLLHQAVNASR